MLFAVVALSLSLVSGAAADVTGKWDGKISGTTSDGSKREDTALLVLKQNGNEISGSIGGSETDQHSITKGTIDGDKITIIATNANNNREYRLDLTLKGNDMTGTLSMGERKADIALTKRKE
jgi:hypothetical protein